MVKVLFVVRGLVTKIARLFGYHVYVGKRPPKNSLGEHLNDLFSQLQINCVFDVGAHFGEYGLFLRSIGYKGHIISFEPVATSFNMLKQQCAHDSKWHAHRLALGDREGTFPINVTRATNLSSFLAPNNRFNRSRRAAEVERAEMVEMKPLDSIFSECVDQIKDPHVYLKMDTQGYDLKALKGAEASLDTVRALQLEISVKPLYEDMIDWTESIEHMNQFGFDLTGLFPVNRDKDLRIIEFDCVMIHRRWT